MFCKKCGEEIGESNYCPKCGEKAESKGETSTSETMIAIAKALFWLALTAYSSYYCAGLFL